LRRVEAALPGLRERRIGEPKREQAEVSMDSIELRRPNDTLRGRRGLPPRIMPA
jgi:hypothetical protein